MDSRVQYTRGLNLSRTDSHKTKWKDNEAATRQGVGKIKEENEATEKNTFWRDVELIRNTERFIMLKYKQLTGLSVKRIY